MAKIEGKLGPLLKGRYYTARFETTDAKRIHSHIGVQLENTIIKEVYDANGDDETVERFLNWAKV